MQSCILVYSRLLTKRMPLIVLSSLRSRDFDFFIRSAHLIAGSEAIIVFVFMHLGVCKTKT